MKSQGAAKVYVGVSGGVDSSVALAMLKEAGYDVTGVFLKVWNPDWMECNWREERRSAMRVCAVLGVPFETWDCQAEYKKEVVDYMIREYAAGRVPNPDIFCNKYVKFGVFLDKALARGADYIATGHYARLGRGEPSSVVAAKVVEEGNPLLLELHEAADKEKDQSYFLYTLTQKQLAHVLFPIGDITKPEVRKCAAAYDLPTATKKDSQGLCFIGKVDMKDFLKHYITTAPGNVLDVEGNIIGIHDGALLYAIGERHGFTITQKTPNEPRLFVVAKDIERNTLTVAGKESIDTSSLSARGILIRAPHLIGRGFPSASAVAAKGAEEGNPLPRVQVRIRYRQEKQWCTVEEKFGGWHVTFDTPQSGVSVGQSAVFYDGEACLGGGIIDAIV